jgi:hypothetical protein
VAPILDFIQGAQLTPMQMESWSPSGLRTVPHLQWGSHLAHFFGSGGELRDLLVPYFKAGLENNERCLWVTGEAFTADQARSALRAAVPDLDKRERDKQIEIANGAEWYATGQKLRPDELVSGLLQREQDALGLGYVGLRTNGNCAWVSQDQWADFQEYERLVQEAGRSRRMICMCSYCITQLADGSHLQVMQRHDLALRLIEHLEPAQIRHVPRVLYHRNATRDSSNVESVEPACTQEESVRAVNAYFSRNGIAATAEPHTDPLGRARPGNRKPHGHFVRRDPTLSAVHGH